MEIKDIVKEELSYKPIYDKFADNEYTTNMCFKLYQAFSCKAINYDNANFYILSPKSDIDRIAKISTLMPSTITLTNLNSIVTQIDHGLWCSKNGYSEYEVMCHLPSKELFDKCGKLFSEGILQYYPNISYYIINSDGSEEWYKKDTIENPCAVVDATPKEINSDLIDYALSLDIPYIHEASIADFSDIAINNIDALTQFKKLFKKGLYSLDFNKDGEKADFEYTLNAEVNKIGEKYKKDCSILRKNLTIGAIATVATSLLIFTDTNTLLNYILRLSSGTGILKLIDSIWNFHIEKTTIRSKDYYFLWLIKKATKK